MKTLCMIVARLHRLKVVRCGLFAGFVLSIITLVYLDYRASSIFDNQLEIEDSPKNEDDDEWVLQPIERQWKEPEWKVVDLLLPPGTDGHQMLPVIVVEEHHEVLKYWFDAAESRVIPEQANTLIHIDGHSDDAPPSDLARIPWLHPPVNHSQVADMMQSNDVFIAGAGASGLINRFIWIWPEWVRPEKKLRSDHEVDEVFAGWRFYYPTKGEKVKMKCACMRTRSDPPSKWDCWDEEPDDTLMQGGALVKDVNCTSIAAGVIEYVHEVKALELLRKGEWISRTESILLDVDEDYFGCESSVMPLYHEGLPQKTIDEMSELISKLFCVNDVHSEAIADEIFRALIEIVLNVKASDCGAENNTECLSDFEGDRLLIQIMPSIIVSLEKAGVKHLQCEATTTSILLQVLLRMFYEMNDMMLKALKYVGVCLITSPNSVRFTPNSLHVCHGFNIPGDSSVLFHTPTFQECESRSVVLREIFSLLPVEPALVTVCRSVRDGYTPWSNFTYIEHSILKHLSDVFSGVSSASIHFDDNLLGGRRGWPQRA